MREKIYKFHALEFVTMQETLEYDRKIVGYIRKRDWELDYRYFCRMCEKNKKKIKQPMPTWLFEGHHSYIDTVPYNPHMYSKMKLEWPPQAIFFPNYCHSLKWDDLYWDKAIWAGDYEAKDKLNRPYTYYHFLVPTGSGIYGPTPLSFKQPTPEHPLWLV